MLFLSHLELLSSDGLHVALLSDGEVVGDLGVGGVDLGPGEGIAVLGDLRDQLVVTALLNDVIGDAWSGGEKEESEVMMAQISPENPRGERSQMCWASDGVCLTEQLAEGIISLLGLSFPSSSEGHFGGVGGWRCECRDAEASRGKSKGTETESVPCLYTVHLSPPPSSACDDTREQLHLEMMSTMAYEGEGINLHKRAFMEFPSSE